MRIIKGEELYELYPKIFEKVFGYKPEGHIPRILLLQENDEGEAIGFVSGYLINQDTFYMAWGGSTAGFAGSRNLWIEGEMYLTNNGVKWMTTIVENTNTAWQRMLMKLGYIPHGMKMTQGKIYVEYYKELTDGII